MKQLSKKAFIELSRSPNTKTIVTDGSNGVLNLLNEK
jgi:hypothetical protein